jgi:GNAT superfamily N-acetyltransferase
MTPKHEPGKTMPTTHGMTIDGTSYVIYMREVTGTLPLFLINQNSERHNEAYREGRWFYVEGHVGNFGLYGPGAMGVIHIHGSSQELINDVVHDSLRRKGLARALIEAAGERWPQLSWMHTSESRPFHRRLVAQGIARNGGSEYYDFLPKIDRRETVARAAVNHAFRGRRVDRTSRNST